MQHKNLVRTFLFIVSNSAHYHAAVYTFNMLQFSVTSDKTFEFDGCFVIMETDFGSSWWSVNFPQTEQVRQFCYHIEQISTLWKWDFT